MKIINTGNQKIARITTRVIRFTCKICGCVFEADKNEYTYMTCKEDEECSFITCPSCGKIVFGSYDDFLKEYIHE